MLTHQIAKVIQNISADLLQAVQGREGSAALQIGAKRITAGRA